ncbi:MAG: hypothetical protein GEV28_07185 [Actinophytocola sp.]|uniref:hypothetical protein n=1 Tax=Actinophytocola sp. TaxID=1872138 RepID=UPI00132322BD|nr:hypothetical protein [Actinophytocola sp.]MPZ80177.1 hypothetical protein [Actinophytocola sp.]
MTVLAVEWGDPRFVTHLISVPLFTGVIGYITNWTGVIMLFQPMRFHGVRLPGLRFLYSYLPRRVQVIPAITCDGRFGWQGIIPSRVSKMASISVDKALLKVGSIGDFYREFEPDKIADHIAATARGEIRGVVERIMLREHPQLWHDLPPVVKDAVHARIQQRLPVIVRGLTDQLGEYIDQLIDAKLLVIRHFEEHPELMNDMLREVGRKELRFMQNFGFYFGFPMGIGLVFILDVLPYWWVLPLGGAVIGWVVNWIGIKLIFEPVFPRKIGPVTFHGLFLRRQPEVSDVMAGIIADDIINMRNIGDELLHGPRSDRTRQMLERSLRPAIDSAVGFARSAVRVGMGTERYDRIRDAMASEAVEFASAFGDTEFGKQQSLKIKRFVARQMRQLRSDEFNELLRSAIKQDEWLLFVHGGVLGIGAGLVHLAIFGG